MKQDEEWLKALVVRRTQETWEESQQPYYISFIATDSTKDSVDYREIISPLRLRQWAIASEIDGVKIVSHPIHKAKVGFIPSDKEYTFDDAKNPQVLRQMNSVVKKTTNRRSTLQFLEALSTLSDKELDEVSIPLKTIVHLLNT